MPRARAILFLIDVEPDARKTREGSGGWAASETALEHLARLRVLLEEATDSQVRFNWFLRADPQIEQTWGRADWVAEACPGIIRTINDCGDYSGIHLHLWRWHSQRGEWFSDFTDPAWTSECLQTSIEAYARIFGRRPDASRFGDRWLDQRTVRLVREMGFRFDLTIEPGLPNAPVHDDRHATAWLPDYRSAPRHPYVPSNENFLVPAGEPSDSHALWMLPLTTTLPSWRLVRRPPYLMKASRSPNLALNTTYVWPHIRTELEHESGAPLSMVLRSGDLASPVFLRNFLLTTGEFVRHPMLRCFEFTTPDVAVARWQTRRTLATGVDPPAEISNR